MNLICPYCKNELVTGFIFTWRDDIKWQDDHMSLFEKYTRMGGEALSDAPKLKCCRCTACNKIIIDLDEL